MSLNPIVLVSGVNGFIGQIIKKALTEEHGDGRVEIVAVPHISNDGAFDKAVKGENHETLASIMTFDKDPSKVIPATVAATTSILNSCLKEPSVKSFVYTSSSSATSRPKPNVKWHIDGSTWNDEDVKDAWKPESEDEKKPSFTVNVVLPSTNFGPVISSDEISSTGNFLKMVYEGMILPLQGVLPQYSVDVRDTGRLHVAAVKFPDVENRWIFARSEPYNWNKVLKVFREIRPEHKFPGDIPDLGEDVSTVNNAADEKLLVRMGWKSWTSFKELMDESLKSYGVLMS
ncbi:related to dihydroflavonol-4-reductase [Phialocephala subalpina]|uniref:Related to dihydroflavonol-4-reductase n=1 Tax=Phialocephala subalpina TaxID=576137 RepID=A0A1L7WM54_9HELO|nr:related to dihydroflavonol-4-reductase [Phialocephala subalpina]